MNHKINYSIRVNNISMFAICLLLSIWTPLAAEEKLISEADDKSSPFEINAPIMMIDLDSNLMIIAEKEIFLSHIIHEGERRWKTEFFDANGQAISVTAFKPRDRVRAEGTITASGKIEANRITLLTSTEKIREKVNKYVPDDSSKQSSSSLHLKNGVWKN